jgi:hypothetical protein
MAAVRIISLSIRQQGLITEARFTTFCPKIYHMIYIYKGKGKFVPVLVF